jgi:hypothetical protein
MGSHLQHSAHSDTHRLTSPNPKMILSTYEIDLHPRRHSIEQNVGASG